MKLLRSACLREDPGPQPLRYASVNGRQLYALASPWPELASGEEITGIYHAVGRERIQITQHAFDIVLARGFDALRPASMIFEHMSLGPPAQLAIALGCRGPFFSFEADDLAGAIALQQACEDLDARRCAQALVASYRFDPPAAWLLLLGAEGPLEAVFRYGTSEPMAASFDPGEDPHGLGALMAAMAAVQEDGRPRDVRARSQDGRGIRVALRRAAEHRGSIARRPEQSGESPAGGSSAP